MRLKFVQLVAWKELLSTWRDTRTVAAAVLMPLLIVPLTVLGLPLLIGALYGGEQVNVQEVGVNDPQHLPEALKNLLERPNEGGGVKLVVSKNPRLDVQEGRFEVALAVPENIPRRVGEKAEITVYSRLNNLKTLSGAASKVDGAIKGYNAMLAEKRLMEVNLTLKDLSPLAMRQVDASREQEKSSGQFAFLIPLLIITYILQGGQPTATDATAGEKERGTLEVLLVTPVQRAEVLMGKFLATLCFSLVTAACSMVGLFLTGVLNHAPFVETLKNQAPEIHQGFGGSLTLNLQGLAGLLLVAFTVALLLSITQLAIALFARSYKEAQTYLIPLGLLTVLASMALQFSDFFQVSGVLYMVPLANAALVILDIVKGKIMWGAVWTTCFSNLLVSVAVFFFALATFKREQVMFRNG